MSTNNSNYTFGISGAVELLLSDLGQIVGFDLIRLGVKTIQKDGNNYCPLSGSIRVDGQISNLGYLDAYGKEKAMWPVYEATDEDMEELRKHRYVDAVIQCGTYRTDEGEELFAFKWTALITDDGNEIRLSGDKHVYAAE